MAGDWIKMTVALSTSPKVVRIVSAFNADERPDRFRVVGALHAVWCLFDQHSTDGKLPGYSLKTVSEIIGWPGFAEAMASVDWLIETEKGVEIPEFETHNGAPAKRRAQESERKRRDRKMSADDADKKRTREEKRRVNTPIVPLPGDGLFPDGFARFWESWPANERKQAKGKCLEIWKRKGCEAIAAEVLNHIEKLKRSDSWREGYVPAPMVYLNQARWQGAAELQAVEKKVAM